jgi:uncharacterized membrane protein YkoI
MRRSAGKESYDRKEEIVMKKLFLVSAVMLLLPLMCACSSGSASQPDDGDTPAPELTSPIAASPSPLAPVTPHETENGSFANKPDEVSKATADHGDGASGATEKSSDSVSGATEDSQDGTSSATASQDASDYIGLDRAKEIALSQVKGASLENISKAKLDMDDGEAEYEVEIRYQNNEYEFDIDALTGAILKQKTDRD